MRIRRVRPTTRTRSSRTRARPTRRRARPRPARAPRRRRARRGPTASRAGRLVAGGRLAELVRVGADRGERLDAVLVRRAAHLAGEAQRREAADLALALDPRGMVLR